MDTPTIKAWIGNYGADVAGESLDDPYMLLPMTKEELDAFIEKNQREAESKTGMPCEEFYISDYDGIPLEGCKDLFNMYVMPDDLNVMAAQLACMDDTQIEAAAAYISNQGSSVTMEEAMNVLLQADDIGYNDYGWGKYTGTDPVYAAIHDSASPQTRFGYMLLEGNPELKEFLESDPCIDAAFDVEEYGRQIEMASDVVLYDDAYLDQGASDVDLNYYVNRREILAAVTENLERTPDFEAIAASFEGWSERLDIAKLRRDIIYGGEAYYSPERAAVVANVNPGAADGHGAVIGYYDGVFANVENAANIAANGFDFADYCRENHLLEPIGEQKWAELAPDMVKAPTSWCITQPGTLSEELSRRDPTPRPEAPMRAEVPRQAAPSAVEAVSQDTVRTTESSRAQVHETQRQAPAAERGR